MTNPTLKKSRESRHLAISFLHFAFHPGREQKRLTAENRKSFIESGAPVGSRTPNLLIRSQTLYPIELRVLYEKPRKWRVAPGLASGTCKKTFPGAAKEADQESRIVFTFFAETHQKAIRLSNNLASNYQVESLLNRNSINCSLP